jgi:hypothetical protein
MTSTTGNLRRLPTFRPDQNDVPPGTRTNDLIELARFIADNTSPAQAVQLQAEDRLLLAAALPNLPDYYTQQRLLDIVAELHTAEMHDRSGDHNQHDAQQAEAHRESAAGLARDLVQTDVNSRWANRGVELGRMRKPALAAYYRKVSGHVWSLVPPERWSKDDLISGIQSAEGRTPGGAR